MAATATLNWPDKGPDEVLDYEIDWTAWLNGDTIATSSWTVPADLTKGATPHDNTTTTVWLSGGIVGAAQYAVLNIIVTTGGRTAERTVFIRCVSK